MKEFNNFLTKYKYKINNINVLSLFSGIGAFEQSLKELGINHTINNFAEIDIDAIISYASIHIDNFNCIEFEYPKKEEMQQWLMDRNIGYDFAKEKSKIPKLKLDKLKLLYKSSVLGNNLGDVSLISYTNKNIDLIVGGSPCQDFSIAGKQKGALWTCKHCGHEYNPLEQHYSKRNCCPSCNNNNIEKTRSSLVVEYLRAIRENKPKYFIYENVKNIVGKQFVNIFNLFKDELIEYGYNISYRVLNAKDFGIPQNRERIFIVGIRNDIDCNYFDFPTNKISNIRLKDILENNIEDKYYIDNERSNKLINQLKEDGYLDSQIVPCDITLMKSERLGGLFDDKIKHQAGSVWSTNGLSPTLDTAQGGYREPCIVHSYKIRKLTPKECWRLMGFRDECIDKCIAVGISDSQLYKQAGNSIVVNVLYYIFKELFSPYMVEEDNNK